MARRLTRGTELTRGYGLPPTGPAESVSGSQHWMWDRLVKHANDTLSKVEQGKRFRVLAGPWLPDFRRADPAPFEASKRRQHRRPLFRRDRPDVRGPRRAKPVQVGRRRLNGCAGGSRNRMLVRPRTLGRYSDFRIGGGRALVVLRGSRTRGFIHRGPTERSSERARATSTAGYTN